MSSGYQLHKFKENMFQRQILFQIKVIAETWCQLCLELSQPCLRALRNSPFIHWEVATNCAWLQATKMLYCKETWSPSQQTAIAQFCKQDSTATKRPFNAQGGEIQLQHFFLTSAPYHQLMNCLHLLPSCSSSRIFQAQLHVGQTTSLQWAKLRIRLARAEVQLAPGIACSRCFSF